MGLGWETEKQSISNLMFSGWDYRTWFLGNEALNFSWRHLKAAICELSTSTLKNKKGGCLWVISETLVFTLLLPEVLPPLGFVLLEGWNAPCDHARRGKLWWLRESQSSLSLSCLCYCNYSPAFLFETDTHRDTGLYLSNCTQIHTQQHKYTLIQHMPNMCICNTSFVCLCPVFHSSTQMIAQHLSCLGSDLHSHAGELSPATSAHPELRLQV